MLSPSHRTKAGHRLYGAQDIIRLQRILSLQQLGFSLSEIRECLDSPDFSLLERSHVTPVHLMLGLLEEDEETPEQYTGIAIRALRDKLHLDLSLLGQQPRSAIA